MKKCLLIFALASPLWAQVSNPGVVSVPIAPTACSTVPLKVVNGTNDLYGTNGSGGCSEIGGSTTAPGGSSGQIQYNNGGAFGGASGGTTNGTHWAFGAGSTIDSVPTTAPDSSPSSSKAIGALEETYTGADYENGQYVGLTLNPVSPGSNNFPIGIASYLTLANSPNWPSGGLGGVTPMWSAEISQVNTPNNGSNLFGFVSGIYVNGTAEIPSGIGFTTDVENNSTATMDLTYGYYLNLINGGGGLMTQVIGISPAYEASNGSKADLVDQIQAPSPSLADTATIGTLVGLDIQEQATAGVTTGIGILQEGADPNTLNGLTTFGDLVAPGILVYADIVTKVAAAGGDGWQANCSDCDTPITEGGVCAATGDHAGALAIQLRGALHCF